MKDRDIDMSLIEQFYKNHEAGPIGEYRRFAVTIPYIEKGGEVFVLLEKRAMHMKSQPGEICFPGGQVEDGEVPLEAALRETWEEIGIPKDNIEVLGTGDILYGYANYSLHTFPVKIKERELENMSLSEDEVDSILLVPLNFFVENEPEIHLHEIHPNVEGFPYEKVGIDENYSWRVGKWMIPIYRYKNGENVEIIWGLTARILYHNSRILYTFTKKIKKV